MNEKKLQAKLRGLNAIETKVYEAIPIVEEWSPAQIHAEIYRLGRKIDHEVVAGCLRAMREAGIIKVVNNKYKRTPIEREQNNTSEMKVVKGLSEMKKPAWPDKPSYLQGSLIAKPELSNIVTAPVAKPIPAPVAKTTTPLTLKKQDMPTTALPQLSIKSDSSELLNHMAEQAASLRAKAKELIAQADQLDGLALVIVEREEKHKKDLKQLQQLRTIMRSIQDEAETE